MKNFYTTLDLQDGLFVGSVFESNTNREIYKTSPYPSQSQVTKDINIFLKTKQAPVTPPQEPVVIRNTIQPTTITGSVKRCCGR